MSDTQGWIESLLLLDTDECVLWPFSLRNGYGQLKLNGKVVYAHQVVCERAHGCRPRGKEVAHGPCHNRSCVNPRHLSWKTRRGNALDRHRDGTFGEGHPCAKLTAQQVAEIRATPRTRRTRRELASKHGVSTSLISAILLERLWK
jgi:hypothetical protein